MLDPNVTYKESFAELRARLGRVPTATEALPLHEEYKRGFIALASAAGPVDMGFSRKPAPQARTYDSDARTREGQADEALSGPGAPEIIPEPVSEPEPPPAIICTSEPVLVVASAPCRACGREFERVARRGRPPVKCEECR